MIRFR